MGAYLDIHDVCAGHPKAQAELQEMVERITELTQEIERLNRIFDTWDDWFKYPLN
jgi:cell division protein FtsB